MESKFNLDGESSLPYIDVECIERCIKLLKPNKAAGHDGISTEHILNSHPALVLHLKVLFEMFLKHSYVPNALGIGIIIPIIKDKHGDFSSVDNYRPITLSPIISKIFESFLLDCYSSFLYSDDLQFGFKKHLSCSDAIFALRQTIQYFNARDSNVYIASLDASKAFDRINHFKLYSILLQKGVPIAFINVIKNWYSKLQVLVRWNGHDSSLFHIASGVRQGELLSPCLFNYYVNNIILSLRKLNIGCHIENMFIGCIVYADDLLLLSASVVDLQIMLDKCDVCGNELGIKFNSNKSKCIFIGPNQNIGTPATMFINDSPMKWDIQFKYLGIIISSGKSFEIILDDIRRKFFVSVNSI